MGTLIPHFKKGDFDKLHLHIPDEATQKFAGDIYFHLSAKIELNRQMNRTLEAMARAIFKNWFVDFDPVRAKAAGQQPPGLKPEIAAFFPDSFEDSELGEIPRGWRVQSFTDGVDVIGGGTPKTSIPEYWGGEIPWFSVTDTPAAGEVFAVSTDKTITQEGVNNSSTRVLGPWNNDYFCTRNCGQPCTRRGAHGHESVLLWFA